MTSIIRIKFQCATLGVVLVRDYSEDVSDCVAEGASDEELLERANQKQGFTETPGFLGFTAAHVEHTN